MAGIHIKGAFETIGGDEWEVQIWDKDTTTTPNHLMNLSSAPVIKYEGNESLVPMFNVMYSNAMVGFRVEDATDLGYIESIIGGDENQFYLILIQGETIKWRGIVLQDGIKIDRRSYPFEVVLTANDGLARLDDVKITLGVTPFVNLIELLDQILSETLITNANFGGSENFISTVCRWYETSMFDAFDSGVDPLRYSKIYDAADLYKSQSNDGVVSYRSYGEALKDILKIWGLCIKQRDGHWYLVQVDAYQNATLVVHSYTAGILFSTYATAVSSGTASSANYNHAESIATSGEILDGEHYSFAPIMREARLKVENLENKQVVKPSYFTGLTALTTLGGVVSGNFSTGVRLRLNLVADISAISWANNFLLEWQITIKCGSNYFTNQGGSNRWTTTATDYFTVQQILPNPGQARAFFPLNNSVGGGWYDIVTNSIPTSDDLEIQVKTRLLSLIGNALTGVTTHSIDGSIAVDYFNYNAYTAPNDEVQYYIGTNTKSSFVFDLGTTQIADDPETVFDGKLMISTGVGWQDSETWKRFTALNPGQSIVECLLDSIYAKQQNPLHILNASIINTAIDVIGTITVDSKAFYLQRGEYNIGNDTWSGSWIELKEYAEFDGSVNDIRIGIGNESPSNQNGTNGLIDAPWRMNNGFLRVTETNEILTGTMADFDVVNPGQNVANADDELMIVNPYNGQTENVVLSASFEDGATNVEIDSHSFTYDFPIGSIVAVPLKNVIQRIYNLENP